MGKKRKGPDEPINDSVTIPQTFRDINNLTNVELNGILCQLHLQTKGKRVHRYTVLERHLNLKTHDGDVCDPFLQTLSDIHSLRDGWTKDLRQVPNITLEQIKCYLNAAHDIAEEERDGCFDASLRAYNALRAYDLWESGHISGYQFNPLSDMDDHCALMCLANPSGDTSGTQYMVTVVLSDIGKPIGGSFTCVGGLGEACTHIGGILFGIEDFVARGYRELPDCESTTDLLCRWVVPKGPKVDPKPIRDKNSTKKSRKGEKG